MMLSWRKPVSFHASLKFFIINRLSNLLLPFRPGEGVRVVAANRQLRIDVPYLIATVLNERILNVLFLAFIGFTLTFYIDPLRPYRMALFPVIIAFLAVILWILWQRQNGIETDIAQVEEPELRGRSRLYVFWTKLVRGIAILKTPHILAGSLVSSLVSWCCVWFGILLMSKSLKPDEPMICALAVLFFMNIVSLMHLTPSNIGPFQWGCILAFSYFGVGKTEAVGFSLVLQSVRIVAACIIGLYSGFRTFILPGLKNKHSEIFKAASD